MVRVIAEATPASTVLFVHSPYPGALKFRGIPSSLLAAAAPFACSRRDSDEQVGILDPVAATPGFYDRLGALLSAGRVRVLCISTSTAAIEETARIAALAKELAPQALVVAGGPHEDDCDLKIASRLPSVDLSIAGDAEFALEFVLNEFLAQEQRPPDFCRTLPRRLHECAVRAGRFSLSSSCWHEPATHDFDLGPIPTAQLATQLLPDRLPDFSVFQATRTLPLMVSRGCPYGKCTFCAEGKRGRALVRHEEFDWIARLVQAHPSTSLYFQDSIFPSGPAVRGTLLPLLSDLGIEWGAQVYLRTLSRRTVEDLASHGCRYLYTGLEGASPELLEAIGKPGLCPELALERLAWLRDAGIRVGISLMFGVMAPSGALLETPESVALTVDLAHSVVDTGIQVTGFYPNVQTVLPGTEMDRGLCQSGIHLDFYHMPKSRVFDTLEDGGIGHNFLTIKRPTPTTEQLAEAIRKAAAALFAAHPSSDPAGHAIPPSGELSARTNSHPTQSVFSF